MFFKSSYIALKLSLKAKQQCLYWSNANIVNKISPYMSSTCANYNMVKIRERLW